MEAAEVVVVEVAGTAAGADMSDWRYWLILAVWVVWEVYWGVSARGAKRTVSSEPFLSRLPVVAGLALVIFLLFASPWLGGFLGRDLPLRGDPGYFAGLILALGGCGFAFWARHTLGRNWSGRVTIKEDHELVTAGPYRWVRHPIYTGGILIVAGSALALGKAGGLVSIAIMLAIFLHKIRLEEKVLEGHFRQRYADYRKQTKTLIPLIW